MAFGGTLGFAGALAFGAALDFGAGRAFETTFAYAPAFAFLAEAGFFFLDVTVMSCDVEGVSGSLTRGANPFNGQGEFFAVNFHGRREKGDPGLS